MRFVLRRLGFFALTLWAAMTVNFIIPRLMPGSPGSVLVARYHGRLSPSALHALEVAFGINPHQNVVVAYFEYLGNSFTGHFGVSLAFFPQSVLQVVLGALPWTLGLVGVTTLLAFVLGTFIGMISAWRRGGVLDSVLPPIFVISTAFPYFWIGMLCILLFSVVLGWFPSGFGYSTDLSPEFSFTFIGDVLVHSILPALTLLVTSIGLWILTMRNNMIATLSEDYVRMARAKGLKPWRIMVDYAGRNAILPNLTGFAMSLGFVMGGATLVEYVFNYPGVGFMLLESVNNSDFALMQALFALITVAVLVSVVIADIATALLDPRTRSNA